MRITFFVGEFSEGGAERVISILSNSMIERGFDIEILKYYKSDNFYQLNPNIKISSVEEQANSRSTIKNISWLRKHFKNNSDLIISFLAPFNIISLLANKFNNIPIIVADRNDPRFVPSSKFRRLLRDYLYKYANKVVVQTKHNKDYFSNIIQNKTEIIPNPINIDEKVGQALITKKENLIVQVARLEKQKNQYMLIEAFNEIKDEYPNYKLVIYGEGSYRCNLENRIKELKLEDKILLPGNTKDVVDKISKAKLYVCSSNYEGMSNSLLEAMSIGLPVISTNVSGTEEIIINNKNGILININDKDALVSELRRLLKHSNLQKELGTNASKISEAYTVDKITSKWIDVIKDIIK